MPRTATALSSWAKAIRKALEAQGHDSNALFLKAGLDISALDNPNARYPVDGTTKLWRLAVATTGDPAFGLTVASHVTPTTFHALGYSLVASATLKEAFERLLRFFRIVTDAAELEFLRSGDEYQFVIHIDPNGPQPADEAIDAFMAVNLRMCRALYRREFSPTRVQLCRPAPTDPGGFERVFRAPLIFGARENLMAFDCSAFEAKLEGANPELARHNDEIVAKYIAHYEHSNITDRVHGAIIELLSLGEPSQEKIAAALHMSLRNLQRKLAAENTSYKTILNDTRRDLALSYIKDPKYTLSEITYLLGFSDTSNFSRAFRRWTGKAPKAYRADASSSAG